MPKTLHNQPYLRPGIAGQLDLVLNSGQICLWNLNLDTNQISGNRFWGQLIGLSEDVSSIDLSVWLARIHPEQRAAVAESLEAFRQGETDQKVLAYSLRDCLGEYQAISEHAGVTGRTKDGAPRWISGVIIPSQAARSLEHSVPLAGPYSRQRPGVPAANRPGGDRPGGDRPGKEIALINWLVEMFQLCSTTDEAFEVLASTLKHLFQAADGLLAQPNGEPDQMQVVVQWGAVAAKPTFFFDDCWALRRRFIHLVDDGNRQLACKHLLEPVPAASICIPMIVQEEILGVFYLCHQTNPHYFDPAAMQLIQAVADSAAVAMDNISLRETLRQQSIRDPLTRLFNRRYMEETLARELKRAERSGYPLSLILLDIDYFKRVNDTHGHQAGDSVLRDLGSLLLGHTRADDVACRYGGEEFLLILPNTSRQAALGKAQSLRELIKQMEWHFSIQEPTRVTVSLGISVYPADGKAVTDLLQVADTGLYQAKHLGRDRIICLGQD